MVSNIIFCGNCKSNLATTCYYACLILYKNLQLFLLLLQLQLQLFCFNFNSSLTNNISPPTCEFRSNLYGVLNPSIKKFPMGKLSSIFVSETSNTTILPLTLYAPISQNGQTHSNNSLANCRQIVWACLAILSDCRLKG